MKKEYEDVITEYLGVEPIEINSSLVSAQRRKRLYWTNIPGVQLPADKGILLENIVHENEPDPPANLDDYKVPFDDTFQILNSEVQKGKIGYFRKDSQANRVYSIHGKAVTLCGEAGGGAAKMGQYLFGTLPAQARHGILIDGYIRKLTPIECERLQNLPDNYTLADGVPDPQRYKTLGNGWTVDVIAHIFDNLQLMDELMDF